jgi:glycosyltransferase involved in cell wall biosynthesis
MMNEVNPLVSVVMAVYNGEKYLTEAIESIQKQTCQDFEFIMIDDASTDRSGEIIEKFQRSDKRIRAIRNEKNSGLGVSLNRGVSITKGQFIARMDADDISQPDRFERQLTYLKQNPGILVLGGSCIMIDEQGKEKGTTIFPNDPDLMRWNMLLGNGMIIVHGTAMFRREFFERFGNYGKFRAAQDFELWTRTFDEEPLPIANLGEVIYTYRNHENTTTNSQNNLQERNAMRVRQQKIEAFLGKAISPNVVLAYRHPGDHYVDIRSCILVWNEIYEKFMSHFHVNKETRALIKAELLYEINKYTSLRPNRSQTRQRASFWGVAPYLKADLAFGLLRCKLCWIKNPT